MKTKSNCYRSVLLFILFSMTFLFPSCKARKLIGTWELVQFERYDRTNGEIEDVAIINSSSASSEELVTWTRVYKRDRTIVHPYSNQMDVDKWKIKKGIYYVFPKLENGMYDTEYPYQWKVLKLTSAEFIFESKSKGEIEAADGKTDYFEEYTKTTLRKIE